MHDVDRSRRNFDLATGGLRNADSTGRIKLEFGELIRR
jgi:hypothetical protein